MSPKKITIGAFRMDNFQSSAVNQSIISCNENITISLHFSEDPI